MKNQTIGGNMKTKFIALCVGASILFTPVAASAQVCGIGIIVAAMVANAQEHRELTQQEANTCGLMYGQDRKNIKKQKHAYHGQKHKKKKPQN
jgi:hypothetical protein